MEPRTIIKDKEFLFALLKEGKKKFNVKKTKNAKAYSKKVNKPTRKAKVSIKKRTTRMTGKKHKKPSAKHKKSR